MASPILVLAPSCGSGRKVMYDSDSGSEEGMSDLIRPIGPYIDTLPAIPAPALALPKKGALLARRGKKLSLTVQKTTIEAPVDTGHEYWKRRLGEDGAFVGNVEIKLDDLRVVDKLGEGAQGYVEKVEHVKTGEIMARKCIRMDLSTGDSAAKTRDALFTEAKTYAESTCSSIVGSFGCFFDEGVLHILLEYMDCGSLDGILKHSGALSEGLLAAIAFQTTQGLTYLHEGRHLVHRDIKPANVLLNSNGEAKISDFGVSKAVLESIANCDTFVGTCAYMSPERIDTSRTTNGYSYPADVWALGLVLVECACGRYPYPSPTEQLFEYMQAVTDGEAPIDRWLPEGLYSDELREFVGLCLKNDPAERPTARELLEHSFLHGADTAELAVFLRDLVMFEA